MFCLQGIIVRKTGTTHGHRPFWNCSAVLYDWQVSCLSQHWWKLASAMQFLNFANLRWRNWRPSNPTVGPIPSVQHRKLYNLTHYPRRVAVSPFWTKFFKFPPIRQLATYLSLLWTEGSGDPTLLPQTHPGVFVWPLRLQSSHKHACFKTWVFWLKDHLEHILKDI